MATLKEYYVQDFQYLLSGHTDWKASNSSGGELTITAKVHLDFDAHVFFISFYAPFHEQPISLIRSLLNKISEVIKIKENVLVESKLPGDTTTSSANLIFSGKIFFYCEGFVDGKSFEKLQEEVQKNKWFLHCRDYKYSEERSKVEKPYAFISHDSRDKESIARPLAEMLSKKIMPVWYDEYSLYPGDNLRDSIDKGLKECKKCILVLTPNFLANKGWTKTEFDSIFIREILETKSFIIPIWAGVSKENIFNYSPSLLNKVGISWDLGIDEVTNKIQRAILK